MKLKLPMKQNQPMNETLVEENGRSQETSGTTPSELASIWSKPAMGVPNLFYCPVVNLKFLCNMHVAISLVTKSNHITVIDLYVYVILGRINVTDNLWCRNPPQKI